MRSRRSLIRSRVLAGLMLISSSASGQVFERPADERRELPAFEAPEAEDERPLRGSVLPPIPLPRELRAPLPPSGGVFVRQIRIEGSSIYSTAELQDAVQPYIGRVVFAEELVEVRKAITGLYVERGYVNSGAVIPPQDLREGSVLVRIIEGSLTTVEISGTSHLRERYVHDRILTGASVPLNVDRMEEALRRLQENPRILTIRARLTPGEDLGEAVLRVTVVEAVPYVVWGEVNNMQPPSLGGIGGDFFALHQSLLGFGDSLDAWLTIAEGLTRVRSRYEVPVNRWDTTIGIRGEWSDSEIVDSLGRALNVRADAYTIALYARQPVQRSRRSQLWLEVHAAYRRSDTSLLGIPFSFVPGPERGTSKIAALRFVQDWTYRTPDQAIAARSTLSVGLDALGATVNPTGLPDGRYVAWLAQLQWASRLPWLSIESLVRADIQLANDPLLPLEQIGVGGIRTVRGYRENVFVRDQAAITSLELRVPLLRLDAIDAELTLVPFFDYAYSWNRERPTIGRRSIASPGVGFQLALGSWGDMELYWGYAIWKVPAFEEDTLQDNGIHFRVRLTAF
ncbi:MAG: ShlB/FhaC/HecB family hemolysin secretion/activation protein [Deltaproteobacteria bacterium]|nr:ShlB/FhaC/HecB family hemolysin secretion/activation protein [Deltaproteobacteria bacterium]MBW2384802.1 ShlB/FhaC/HecB family hemolysin secretion/activation protein [Deltaproteobacteria bacterium]